MDPEPAGGFSGLWLFHTTESSLKCLEIIGGEKAPLLAGVKNLKARQSSDKPSEDNPIRKPGDEVLR
jgi:hypothetical protein